MKNVFSTLLMLLILLGCAVGGFVLYNRVFESAKVAPPTPEEIAIEIEMKIGDPFLDMWANRDIKKFAKLSRGEFGAAVPAYAEWSTADVPPFDLLKRSTIEEERDSVSDLDMFLGYLFDPIAGLDITQIEFSVLETADYDDGNWYTRVMLAATGIDRDSHVVTFQSEQEVIVRLPPENSKFTPSITSFVIEVESMSKSKRPIADEILAALPPEIAADWRDRKFSLDVADFDGDKDSDIAITFQNGQRAVLAYQDGKYENVIDSLGIGNGEPMSGTDLPRTHWLDVDLDRRPDLISGKQLFKNDSSGKFIDVSEEYDFARLLEAGGNSLGSFRRSIRK